ISLVWAKLHAHLVFTSSGVSRQVVFVTHPAPLQPRQPLAALPAQYGQIECGRVPARSRLRASKCSLRRKVLCSSPTDLVKRKSCSPPGRRTSSSMPLSSWRTSESNSSNLATLKASRAEWAARPLTLGLPFREPSSPGSRWLCTCLSAARADLPLLTRR